ncbi:hypothetical protein [Halosimplex amylolyticum]|uniref:hypothetical protein n=1 Tax=Halosimplex amylolyticum TaxID=3396616 RepID=UPI003F5690FA
MSRLTRVSEYEKPVIIAVVLFLATVVIYLETDLYTADEAVAFGTLFLALITAITVYYSRRQTEYMRKEVEFMRRPRLSIHHETDDERTGFLVFENTGQVPIEATVQLSLAPVAETESEYPILDDEIAYEDLPDRIKVYEGGMGDWRNTTEFLEPGQKEKYIIGMFGHEMTARDNDYDLEDFHWIRVDGTIKSNIHEEDTRLLQRLYIYSIDDSNVIFSSYSFLEARRR